MQTHSTGARLPEVSFYVAQPGKFLRGLTGVGRAEQGRVFNTGVDCVRISQRRFEVPDPLELPGMLRAVIPLVRRERFPGFCGSVVDELVALPLGHTVGSRGRLAGWCSWLAPGFAAVIRALNDLSEPTAGL